MTALTNWKEGGQWAATAVDTDGGGVTLTKTATTAMDTVITGIQYSGDAAALVTIESPASTVLWRKRFAAAFTGSEAFPPGAIVAAAGQSILVKISAGTTNTEANAQGYVIG